MENSSDRRVAIVTGGGTWIGASIVAALVKDNRDVLVVGRRRALIEDIAHKFSNTDICIEAYAADICKNNERKKVVETCLKKFGRIDILVNNAAITHIAPLLDYPISGWKNVMNTNLEAPFFLTQLVLADMRSRSWGRIINIASVYGSISLNNDFYPESMPGKTPCDRGPVRASAYHASKGALINLTRELAVAVAPWGITVNSVSPGMVPPDNSVKWANGLTCNIDALKYMTPMRRVGRPEEIADAVRYFASDEASFTTGVDLLVDGGWSAW